jgi:hypothetical protein
MDPAVASRLSDLERRLGSALAELLAAALRARASPVDVRRELDGLASRASTELDELAAQVGAADARIMQLRARLSTLGEAEERGYAASLPARAAVSSVFANAKATAAQQPWKLVEYKAGFTYSCVHCGAPQQATLDFKCRFCGKHITQKGDGP